MYSRTGGSRAGTRLEEIAKREVIMDECMDELSTMTRKMKFYSEACKYFFTDLLANEIVFRKSSKSTPSFVA